MLRIVRFLGMTWLVIAPSVAVAQKEVKATRPLELRIEAQKVQGEELPLKLVLTLVNSSKNEVRLPYPVIECHGSYTGSLWLRNHFTPFRLGDTQVGHGCSATKYKWPNVANRVKEWKRLKPGETLVFTRTSREDLNPTLAGKYEFYADYEPPYLSPEDQMTLDSLGITFPREAVQSQHLIFIKKSPN